MSKALRYAAVPIAPANGSCVAEVWGVFDNEHALGPTHAWRRAGIKARIIARAKRYEAAAGLARMLNEQAVELEDGVRA